MLAKLIRAGLAGSIVAAGLVLAPIAMAQDDKVVATVGGKPITEADLKLAEGELDQQFARLTPEQRRAAALSAIIEIRIMADKATADGLDKDAEFQRRMAFLNQRALHAAVIEKDIASQITDEVVRSRYDTEIAAAKPTNEVKARHILVKTKEEADAVIKQLDEGGDFEAIAKEKSTDAGSGANGGDLGYFGPGQIVPEFETAAFALDVGAYTKEPVQSQFGFHVIKVEDKRSQQPPAFDQVKEQVRSLVFRDKYLEMVKNLRSQAQVEITDPALKTSVEAIEKTEEPAAEKPAE